MAVCCLRWLGMFTTYGMGGAPPPPGPPVPHDSDCHAVSVPSFFAPTLTLAKAEGRQPASSSSASRSSITGPACRRLSLKLGPCKRPSDQYQTCCQSLHQHG